MEQKVSFLKRKMPVRVCFLFCVVIGFFIAFSGLLARCDKDLWYTIATGREIVTNGFPHHSVWNIDRTDGFVVQQWLYCVIAYYLDFLPVWSYSAFAMVQVIILAILTNILLKQRGISGYKSYITIGVSLIVGSLYIFTHRPETATLILLISECIALEKFRSSFKSRYLIWLPVLMLIEMNMHGSMWPMHYAILAAYMVPAFYFKKAKCTAIFSSWKKLLPYIIAMTAVMFVNPYGWRCITYSVQSMMTGAFNKLEIAEMMVPYVFSPSTCVLIISVFFLFFIVKYHYIDSITMNMALGFTVLSLFSYRHVMFSYIIMVFVISSFLQIDSLISKINIQKDLRNYYYIPLSVISVITVFSFLSSFINASCVGLGNRLYQYDPSMYAITQYLEKNHVDKHTRIFTGSSGSYLEYFGYDNIYFDTRYELYSSAFTGGVDYANDFYKYCEYGFADTNYGSTGLQVDTDSYLADDGSIDQWLQNYDFQYFIVNIESSYLSGYLAGNPNYRLVNMEEEYGDNIPASVLYQYTLYEKVN